MSFPVGPILSAFAARILANLDHIQALSDSEAARGEETAYPETQLLVSLLGVLVLPHEHLPGALGALLAEYSNLDEVIRVRYPSGIEEEEGQNSIAPPLTIEQLPRFLRNSIAHLNILPLKEGNRMSGVRVWNVDDDNRITMVADLDLAALRPLSRHVLSALAEQRRDLKLDDPQDPLLRAHAQGPKGAKRNKAPRLTDTIWTDLLHACGGDEDAAKIALDRVVRYEAKRLREGGPPRRKAPNFDVR